MNTTTDTTKNRTGSPGAVARVLIVTECAVRFVRG